MLPISSYRKYGNIKHHCFESQQREVRLSHTLFSEWSYGGAGFFQGNQEVRSGNSDNWTIFAVKSGMEFDRNRSRTYDFIT